MKTLHISTWTKLTNITWNKISQREETINNIISIVTLIHKQNQTVLLRAVFLDGNTIKEEQGNEFHRSR